MEINTKEIIKRESPTEKADMSGTKAATTKDSSLKGCEKAGASGLTPMAPFMKVPFILN